MALILLTAGALVAALLILNNLIKAFARTRKIGFIDLLLMFMAVLLALTALIVNRTDEGGATAADGQIDTYALILGGAIIVCSVIIVVIEVVHPQRLKASRGLFGLFAGLMLAVSSFTVPFAATYFEVRDDVRVADADSADAAVTVEPDATATPLEPTAAAEARQRERGIALFNDIRTVVMTQVNLPEEEVFRQLEAGTPISELVGESGGDLEIVITGITEIMVAAVQDSVQRGEINPFQAALALSQMENFVRIAANSDLNTLGGGFDRPTPGAGTPTEPPISDLLTDQPDGSTVDAEPTNTSDVSPTPSRTPTRTATDAPTPTLSRTPIPTTTPFPTVRRYASPTPLPTATTVTPCLASVSNNLRLRSAPEQQNAPDNTLLTIPYGETIELVGKSADGLWWRTRYSDQDGWVLGEYLLLSAGCARLPLVE